MNGVLRKDLYLLWSIYRKTLPCVLLIMGILALVCKSAYFLYFPIAFVVMYGVSTLAVDQSCGWIGFAKSLPVRPWEIVLAKYLSCLLLEAAAVVFALVFGGVLALMDDGVWPALLMSVWLCLDVSVLLLALLMPAALHWGLEKARSLMMVLFLLLVVAVFFLRKQLGAVADSIDLALLHDPWLAAAAMTLLALAGLAVSMVISCRIYDKKED